MKKKKTKIISVFMLVILCFVFAACNMDIGAKTSKSAIPLSAPTNVRVDSSTLKWNFVENAIGYTVKIVNSANGDINTGVGEEIPIEGRDVTSYSLATLAEGDYTIGVKARGDSVLYSSSEYSLSIVTLDLIVPANKAGFCK